MRISAFLLLAACALAQPSIADKEQAALRQALAEAGNSQVDFLRALEQHLFQFPETSQRAELERAIVKAAIEVKDNRRIILYGERVLPRDPENRDLLERVSRLLLADEDKEKNERALEYARRLEKAAEGWQGPGPGEKGAAVFAEQRAIARNKALVYQARATGNLGNTQEAEQLARRAYDGYPTGGAAREIARWLERQDKLEAAVQQLADAFTLPDPATDEQQRRQDRERLGAMHRKWKGSEAGLGDIILASFDRTHARLDALRARGSEIDPNANADTVMEFTITALEGHKLKMESLLGKVVILDFWATWCTPCRAQQPLYEQVAQRFHDRPEVVFLNINTDEDRSLVKPFLDKAGWNKKVYFEDGLSMLLRVTNIPTTIVIGRKGEIVSRMNGFVEHRFVDMLSDRIRSALGEP
ncbi:MAG: redoxin domain-containing protein [Acidimicrobiia bacterium]|nr:redoxin domain-containing protein [Acidimicrobiia bacterium]